MSNDTPFSVMGTIRPWLQNALLFLILGAIIVAWASPRQPTLATKTIQDIKVATEQLGRYEKTLQENTKAMVALTVSLTKELDKRDQESDNLTATLLERYGYSLAVLPPAVPDVGGVLKQPNSEGGGPLLTGASPKGANGLIQASYPGVQVGADVNTGIVIRHPGSHASQPAQQPEQLPAGERLHGKENGG